MRTLCVCLVLALCVQQGVSQTVVSGAVNGTWTASGSPYTAVADIWVNGTLRIEPGVVVRFQAGGLKFSIGSGQLVAKGTAAAPIVFEPLQGILPGLWQGIGAWNNVMPDTLEYCEVRFAVIGVDVGSSANWRCDPVILRQCEVHRCASAGVQSLATGGATAAVSDVRMTECRIHDNLGYGVYQDRNGVVSGASGHPEATFVRCTVYRNGSAGIYQTTNGTVVLNVYNCTIVKNTRDGIAVSGTATVTNCIIAWNGGFGISKLSSGAWLAPRDVLYNDVWRNGAGAYDELSGDRFGYLVTKNANGDSCDANFNLYRDPLVVDTSTSRFGLVYGSPCINAGTSFVGGQVVRDPDGTVPDLGAEFYNSLLGVEGEVDVEPLGFTLLQNYPNPFNPVTAIPYVLARPGYVRLTVVDALGRTVVNLVDAERDAGRYEALWEAGRFPTGMYLCRFSVDGAFVGVKRMLLVK
jgi:hypothetical protein